MASDLLSIAGSGARVARIALDVTAQNIANASTEGYVRRSVRLEELSFSGGVYNAHEPSLAGVRLDRVVRNADLFRQAEARRTGSDAARADAELAGLQAIEAAVEQANVYSSVVGFEAALQQLAADPVSPSLRAATMESARTLASTFNIASTALDAVGEGLHFEAEDGVGQVNRLAQELGRVNLRLARMSDAGSDQGNLLDQRDLLLQQLSTFGDIASSVSSTGTVEVRLGGASGPLLVSGSHAGQVAMQSAADGTVSFTLDASPVTLSGGALAGKAQALSELAATRQQLDGAAASVIVAVNTAQAQGAALDGSAGVALFSGSTAASMALAFDNGAGIATAPAGAAANSRDAANLGSLRAALAQADPAGAMDALIFDVSSTIQGRTLTRDTLRTIAATAKSALQAQAAVDLDQEAVNLIRYQQAFQASGRAMQVASDIFDTLLGIR